MKQLANKLSDMIVIQFHYDDNKKSILVYGLTAIFQIVTIAVIIVFIGIIFDIWCECVTVFLGVSILKRSTGGAHSSSLYGCTFISIISILLFAFLSRYIVNYPTYINFYIFIIIFIICMTIFNKRVPVDSPNKPIKSIDKIKRLRKQSFILLMIYTILGYLFSIISFKYYRFFYISMCIGFVLIWQSLMLTRKSQYILNKIDKLFHYYQEAET